MQKIFLNEKISNQNLLDKNKTKSWQNPSKKLVNYIVSYYNKNIREK